MIDPIRFVVVSIPAIVIVALTVVDVVRRPDLPVVRKVGWLAVGVLLPAVGTLIYLMFRPVGPPRTRGGSRRSAELVQMVERHERGELSDADFAAAKHALLAELGHSGG